MSDAALVEEDAPESKDSPPPADDPPPKEEKESVDPPKESAKKSAATPEKGEKAKDDPPPYWPDDWRQKAAEHYSAGDKALYDKELKRLERISDPAGMYGMYRELEAKFSEGGLTKIPASDAPDEEKAAFWRQLGVPEKAEEYFDGLELADGAILGDVDKPVAEDFATAMHAAGAPKGVMTAALNWYFANQEKQAAELDDRDDKSYDETRKGIREEFGHSTDRYINALPALFSEQPGGGDPSNPKSLMSRLLGGRMSDGTLVGNDRDMLRFLISVNRNINPNATEVDAGDEGGKSMDARIAEIRKMMRTERSAYNKDTEVQAEYRRLIERRDMLQARKRA